MGMNVTTKKEYIYEQIKRDILKGKLLPGTKLALLDFATRNNMSQIPVREAFSQLNKEGLVNLVPHVGAFVAQVDLRNFIELSLSRAELECLAVRLAVPYLGDKDMRKIEERFEKMKTLYNAGAINSEYTHLNHLLCRSYFTYAPHYHLQKIIEDIFNRASLSLSVLTFIPDHIETTIQEHEGIILALKRRDAVTASHLVSAQKHNTYLSLLNSLRAALQTKNYAEAPQVTFFFSAEELQQGSEHLLTLVNELEKTIRCAIQ